MALKTKKIYTTLASGASILVLGSTLGAVQTYAAVLNPTSGTTKVGNNNDTWNTGDGLGATDANINFIDGDTRAFIITGSSPTIPDNANLGDITVNNESGTNTLTVGDGTNGLNLTINGTVSGNVTEAANDLNIIVDAENGAQGTGNSTLILNANVDLGSGSISLDDEASQASKATLIISGADGQSVKGVINGGHVNDGTLTITNTTGATFNSEIGSIRSLNTLNTGDGTSSGGTSIFLESVGALNINANAAAGSVSGTFTKDVTTTTINITGGNNAGETSVLKFGGSISTGIVGGAALWLDATDPNANRTQNVDNSALSLWADKSGNKLDFTQDTAENRPTYQSDEESTLNGNPVISFDGGVGIDGEDDWLSATTNDSLRISNGSTIMVVAKINENSSTRRVFTGDYTFGSIFGFPILTTPGSKDYINFSGHWSNGVAKVAAATFDTDHDVTFYENGTSIGSVVGDGLPTFTNTSYVGTSLVFNEPWLGDVAELLIYNRALTQDEINQNQAYLGEKWGLGNNSNTYGNIILNDDLETATAVFNGDAAQVIGLNIKGHSAGEGTVTVDNITGVAFKGAIGETAIDSINIGETAAGTAIFENTVNASGKITIGKGDNLGTSTATFKNTVTAGDGIVLGSTEDGENDTNNLILDSGTSFTVTGTITGVDANDSNNIKINNSGTSDITFINDVGNDKIDNIIIGSGVDSNVGAIFQSNVAAEFITLGSTGNTNTSSMTMDISSGKSKTIDATIISSEAANITSLAIVNSTDEELAGTATFLNAVGGASAASQIDTLTIGSSFRSGVAIFEDTFYGDSINITSGDNAVEDSSVTFKGNLTAGNILLSANTGDATASFGGNLNVTSIFLNGSADTTKITFDGTTAQTITAKIDGSQAGNGSILITEANGQAPDVDVFQGAIGTTSAQLGSLSIGVFETTAGKAQFNAATNVNTLNIFGGDADAEDSAAQFTNTLEVVNLNLTSGSNGALASIDLDNNITLGSTFILTSGTQVTDIASATIAGNIIGGAIILDNNTSGTTKLTFDGTTEQAISATINGASLGEGTLVILNQEGVTFANGLGIIQAIDTLFIGYSEVGGGTGIFEDSVSAYNIILDASDTNNLTGVTGDFNSNVNSTTISLKGGDNVAESATATFSANVTAAIELDDGTAGQTSATFNGLLAQTLTGSINATTSGEGSVHINNNVTITEDLGATSLKLITVADGKTLTLGIEDLTRSLGATTITIDGTLKVIDTIMLTANSDLTFNNESKLVINDVSIFAAGEAAIVAGTGATIHVGTTDSDTLTLTLPESFTTGSFILFDADQDAAFDLKGKISIENADLFSYKVTNNNGLVTVTAGVQEEEEEENGNEVDNDTNLPPTIIAALASAEQDTVVKAALTSALAAGGIEKQRAIEQSSNSTSALVASTNVIASTSLANFDVIANHLSHLYSNTHLTPNNTKVTGISSGGEYENQQLWLKTFYNRLGHGIQDGIPGYRAEASGIMVGTDLYSGSENTVGVAFSYSKMNIDGKGLGRETTDIHNYQFNLYHSFREDSWYIDNFLGHGRNTTETIRHIDFGDLNRVARGKYNGHQSIAKSEAGMPIKGPYSSLLTPLVGLEYAHVSNNTYTETGAGVLNLNVAPKDLDFLQASFGMRFDTPIDTDAGKILPYVHTKLLYDIAGQQAHTSSSYSGGNIFDVSSPKDQRLGGVIGAGIAYEVNNISASISYDSKIKKNYISHTGVADAKFKF